MVRTGACIALAMLALVGTARAADTEAPPGAPMNWLPHEDWVIRHWIPFDEQDLYAALGISAHDAYKWLDDHEHTLAGLARRRHLDPRRLLDRLTRHRGALLRSRTRRTLTQSHLARHLLFHVFHNRRIGESAPTILGVSRHTWWRMRSSGHTVLEIARTSEHHVRTLIWRLLVREQRIGVARGLTSRREARLLLARQRQQLPDWLRANRLAPHHGG